jgi:type IV pilus assembly protein PilM
MSSLGVYFGPKLISIVETKGKKIINNTKITQLTTSADELEEKVPSQIKGLEIVALFKDELRRNKIEAKEATISLSGKDFIIRTFEMPLLPREELKSAINFEAKKYIPFKVEELVSNFQLKFDKVSRTNTVLFMGIKKEVLDRYISVFNQLNIKINSIEYSAFSTLRLLKLTGLSNKGIMGILGTDLKLEDETNFTVLEDGFPLFSRDIALTSEHEDLEKTEGVGSQMILEKLKTEMRVSLDYFHRKFPTKDIKKIFFVCEEAYRSNLEALMQEIGLSGKFIDITRHIDRSIPYSLSSIKGYSSSLSRVIKSDLKSNLLAPKEQVALLKGRAEAFPLLKGLKLDYKMATLGLLICLATFGFGYHRMESLRKEFNSIISLRAAVATVSLGAPYEDLTDTDSKYKSKLDALDNLIKKQLYVTELLDTIPGIIPKGVWLTKFSFNREGEARIDLSLEGAVYLGNSDKEFGAVNQFLSSLKGAANFIKYFREINIVSMDRRQLDKVTVTNFLILCKSYQEKK